MALDLLAFLNDDVTVVDNAGGGSIPDTPEPSGDGGDPPSDPPQPPVEPNDPPVDPSVDTPVDPTVPPVDPTPEPTPPPTEPIGDLDLGKTFNMMKDLGVLDVDDDFVFDGTKESAEKGISQTLSNLQKSAQAAFFESLTPEWQDAVRYAVANGMNASVSSYVEQLKANDTSDLSNIDINNAEHQKQIIKAYYKETTQHSDAKINKLIDLFEENDTLFSEAKENLTDLINIKESRKAQNQQTYAQAIEQRAEQKRQARKNRETIIDSAAYIEGPRKGKVKAFLNNERQVKGGAPFTGLEKAIQSIMRNEEHFVQLGDILESAYSPEKGFDYERFATKKTSSQISSLRDKLDKHTQPSGGSIAPPTKTFNWEAFLNQQ